MIYHFLPDGGFIRAPNARSQKRICIMSASLALDMASFNQTEGHDIVHNGLFPVSAQNVPEVVTNYGKKCLNRAYLRLT